MQDCDTEHDRSQDLDFVETFAEGTVRCLTDVVNRLDTLARNCAPHERWHRYVLQHMELTRDRPPSSVGTPLAAPVDRSLSGSTERSHSGGASDTTKGTPIFFLMLAVVCNYSDFRNSA
jgi:hypothetical protein